METALARLPLRDCELLLLWGSMTWELDEDVETGLRALGVHDAGPDPTERIRARCVVALEARRKVGMPGSRPRHGVAGLARARVRTRAGTLYQAEAVTRALAVYR